MKKPHRKPMSSKGAKKQFTRTAMKNHRKNNIVKLQRGGYRL